MTAQAGLSRQLAAEAIGTAFLLAAVVGSGIMGERLSGGNVALALLANTMATGAALVVLVAIFGSVSGAHFNPAVTLYFALRREVALPHAVLYVVLQIAGAIAGVWAAHLMFDAPVIEISHKARDGAGQMFSEFVATFGLMGTIAGAIRIPAFADTHAGGALYIGGLLVHRVHLLRQPGGDACSRHER